MEKDLEQRTKRFSLSVLKLCSKLPRDRAAEILARQLIRSATSVGANYREANRAVSRSDFRNKLGTVQKEAAETQYWLELLIESGLASASAAAIHAESSELLAIFTAIGKKLNRETET
ncbi:MAG: four helix bundle protein [Chthoniobacterales bacterium]